MRSQRAASALAPPYLAKVSAALPSAVQVGIIQLGYDLGLNLAQVSIFMTTGIDSVMQELGAAAQALHPVLRFGAGEIKNKAILGHAIPSRARPRTETLPW